ncbi:MAG: EF-P beta-lysylation protein EpmB [Proteobacteria bacterium]|nr:EF-P beta-lysylation protein EpmB [Pseudomonadota bacterium]
MITRTTDEDQQLQWIDELRLAYTNPLQLLEDLALSAGEVDLASSETNFSFRVPRPFVSRMRLSDPNDPLLLQVLPREQEFTLHHGFSLDPVGELPSRRSPGLLQKYPGRALIIATGGCAINCRYCFRRHFPYAQSVGSTNIGRAIDDLQADRSINEVILSGGDPLLLDDDKLAALIEQLNAVPHLRRLRIHTRLPVTIPTRFTDQLISTLVTSPLTPVIVLHINHANEIDDDVAAGLRRFARAGIRLLNQSVLLRGINDDESVLADLSEALFDASVLPYYVHLLDPVAGAAHFDVNDTRARALEAKLRAKLPGYLVPKFVRESAGELSKTPI